MTTSFNQSTPTNDISDPRWLIRPSWAKMGDHRVSPVGMFAAIISGCLLAGVFVGLRFWVRIKILGRIRLDDWLILGALLVLWMESGFGLTAVTYGSTLHFWDIPPDDFQVMRKMGMGQQTAYQFSSILLQLSIIALCMGFAGVASLTYRYFGITLAILCICISIIRIASNFLLKRTWAYFGQSCICLAVDIIIWCMPLPLFWKMRKLSRRKKIGLICTFAVGLLACSVALGRLIFTYQKKKSREVVQWTWNRVLLLLFDCTELSIGIVCACLPPLGPLLLKILENYSSVKKKYSKERHSGWGSQCVDAHEQSEREVELKDRAAVIHMKADRRQVEFDVESYGGLDPCPPLRPKIGFTSTSAQMLMPTTLADSALSASSSVAGRGSPAAAQQAPAEIPDAPSPVSGRPSPQAISLHRVGTSLSSILGAFDLRQTDHNQRQLNRKIHDHKSQEFLTGTTDSNFTSV